MIPNASAIPIYAIVPAAGLGQRMGRPKQTLPFRGTTIIGNVVRTLLGAELDGVVVVTRSKLVPDLDLPIDSRVSIAVNNDAASQMIDSIRIGLCVILDEGVVSDALEREKLGPERRATDAIGILIVPGDLPGLSVPSCNLCVRAFREDPTSIIVATHAGRRGHPLIFPSTLRAEVMQLQGGLNILVERHSDLVRFVETRDPGTVEDVDTWEQYRSLTSGEGD